MTQRDIPNWPTRANVLVVIVGLGVVAALSYAMKSQDQTRMLRGRWTVQLDTVRYDVSLLWPDAGTWDAVTARGHRQWLFRFRADCARIPWDEQQRCIPMARRGDTLTIGAWTFAPMR
jgi:hypothetical protein